MHAPPGFVGSNLFPTSQTYCRNFSSKLNVIYLALPTVVTVWIRRSRGTLGTAAETHRCTHTLCYYYVCVLSRGVDTCFITLWAPQVWQGGLNLINLHIPFWQNSIITLSEAAFWVPKQNRRLAQLWVRDAASRVFSPTCGSERITLMVQATVSMILLFLLASLIPRGLRMADCLSKLMTTVTNAHEYMATSFRNMSSLHAASPACHCTVMFHTASTGITMKVTSRSATVRFIIRILTWDLRLPPLLAAQSTTKLHTADTAHRLKVMMTLTLAAVEKVGSWSASPSVLWLQLEVGPAQLSFTVASVSWWNMVSAQELSDRSHRKQNVSLLAKRTHPNFNWEKKGQNKMFLRVLGTWDVTRLSIH